MKHEKRVFVERILNVKWNEKRVNKMRFIELTIKDKQFPPNAFNKSLALLMKISVNNECGP